MSIIERTIEVDSARFSGTYTGCNCDRIWNVDRHFVSSKTKNSEIVEGWIARDNVGSVDKRLRIYKDKPTRLESLDIWLGIDCGKLDHSWFPEITWESELQKVKIEITLLK